MEPKGRSDRVSGGPREGCWEQLRLCAESLKMRRPPFEERGPARISHCPHYCGFLPHPVFSVRCLPSKGLTCAQCWPRRVLGHSLGSLWASDVFLLGQNAEAFLLCLLCRVCLPREAMFTIKTETCLDCHSSFPLTVRVQPGKH